MQTFEVVMNAFYIIGELNTTGGPGLQCFCLIMEHLHLFLCWNTGFLTGRAVLKVCGSFRRWMEPGWKKWVIPGGPWGFTGWPLLLCISS